MFRLERKRIGQLSRITILTCAAAAGASSARAQAYIQNVTPAPTVVGIEETINGVNFGSTQGSSTVKFGSVIATVSRWSSTQIQVTVPNVTGTVPVTVTVNGRISQPAFSVTVYPYPVITGASPSAGPVGTVVTISGLHFGANYGGYDAVYFGSLRVTPTSWSDTQIVVTVPPGAPTGASMVVFVGVGSLELGLSVPFQVTAAPPVITNVSPDSGIAGTSITISGSGFGPTQGSSTVVFETATATPTSWSATSIVAPVPSGATPGPITVTVGGVSTSVAFTSIPNITGLSPTSGPIGTSVTITGTGFGATQAGTVLTFNGTSATPTSWSTTSITAPVPNGATSGSVVVTEGVAASNGPTFTVTGSNPSISSLSPTSGFVGSSVTITGANFGSSQGTSTVTFNGTPSAPTSWGATSITTPVPAGATTGNVVVTVGGVASNGLAFTVNHANLLIGSTSGDSSSSTFESYDDNGTLLQTGNLDTPRSQFTSTLLKNGTLFVAGGVQAPGTWEILNVNGQLLSSGSLLNALYSHFAVRLANGNVFLGGGTDAPGAWEIHDPTGALVSSGSLLGKRGGGVGAVLLQNGNVWVSGSGSGSLGGGNPGDACTWEIHDPNGNLVSNGSLSTCFSSAKIFLLNNGDVILLGGVNAPGAYEIYTQTGAYVRTGTLTNGFDQNGSAAFLNNTVFIFEQGYWEFLGFDANANTTFDTTGTLFNSRTGSRAVVTSTGNIFITGGNVAPATWEMWTPNGTTATLHSNGNLFDTRYGGHTDTHF